MLAGDIGERNVFHPQALHAAADYIEQQWRSQGHAVERQVYEVEGVRCANLEINCTGSRRPGEVILVGAHYDSVQGSPGANDNASGVAALLELGRLFAAVNPESTLRLVAFVNEEPPFFFWRKMGSMVYAKAACERGDDIRLMLSLEMLGCFLEAPGSQRYPPLLRLFYPDTGNFIAFVSNLRSRKLLHRMTAAFRAGSDFPAEQLATFSLVPGVGWSDHQSFWRRGYHALMVTDTAFYRYRHYHSPRDTPEKLDYESMARVTTGLCQALLALSQETL